MRLRFLLLADCRTGGTALRRLLIARGFDMLDGEPLQYPEEDRTLDPWGEVTQYEGVHVQRYQLESLSLWREYAKLPLRIVSLTRLDKQAQYVSWEVATQTGIWVDHPRRRSLPGPIDAERCRQVIAQWQYEHSRQRWLLGHLPTLDVTYEEFAADNEATADRCAKFLASGRVE